MRGLCALCVLVTACGAPEPARFPVRFVAHADGAPIEGARVAVGSSVAGRTDARGLLDVSLVGREGQVLPLSASCPDGYRAAGAVPPLVLRRLRPIDARDRAERVRIAVPCRPEARTAMLLVRADSVADLPVLIDGREVARTDAHGLAHVQLAYSPHTTFEVVLHTAHRPDLSPRNPPRVFTVPDAERVFVFDQRFARAEAEAAPLRPRRRRAARLPRRIPSAPRWGTR